MKAKDLSSVALAFLGDAIHTLFIRENVLKGKQYNINKYNSICSKFCSAKHQAKVLDEIEDILTEEEKDVVRRARNFKTNQKAKNASLQEYKKATSYEALIGHLHLTGQEEKLNKVLEASFKED